MDAHPDDHNLDDILIEAAITGLETSMPAVTGPGFLYQAKS